MYIHNLGVVRGEDADGGELAGEDEVAAAAAATTAVPLFRLLDVGKELVGADCDCVGGDDDGFPAEEGITVEDDDGFPGKEGITVEGEEETGRGVDRFSGLVVEEREKEEEEEEEETAELILTFPHVPKSGLHPVPQ